MVQHEELTWFPQVPTRQSGEKYKSAIPSEILGKVPNLRAETFASVEQASIEIVRVSEKLKKSNPGYQTLINNIEAVVSSAIEGEYSDLRELTIHQAGKPGATSGTRNVAANVEALNFLRNSQIKSEEPNSVETILESHKLLLQDTNPRIAGCWRTEPVWIGSSFSNSPIYASYVPPRWESVPKYMDDLVQFVTPTWEMPGLIEIALAHAQFETVHPFADGNGRIGRAYAQSLLEYYDLEEFSTIPFSIRFEAFRRDYVNALQAYREGNVNPIVTAYVLSALSGTYFINTLMRAFDKVELGWKKSSTSRAGSTADRLIPYLIGNPIVTMRKVEQLLQVTPAAAYSGIQKLEKDGVLKSITYGHRNQAWEAANYFESVDAIYMNHRKFY